MKYLIIIPAHNEEDYLLYALKSLEAQTFKDFKVMIVNDGSTDRTQKIAHTFSYKNPSFIVLNLETSSHAPGAKVVRTFYKALELIDLKKFDIICKFDADIVFPIDYLEKINQIYENNSKVGMVSGLVKIQNKENGTKELNPDTIFEFKTNNEWIYEDISSQNHIRGPIKSYRKECFFEIDGLRPVLGWDNIDVMMAKKHDWEVYTIKDLWVKHLRPTAYKYRNERAEKLGEYFYNIGLNFPLAAVSSLKSSWRNKSILEFYNTMKSFKKQKGERGVSDEEMEYIQKLRWKNLLRKLKFIKKK